MTAAANAIRRHPLVAFFLFAYATSPSSGRPSRAGPDGGPS